MKGRISPTIAEGEEYFKTNQYFCTSSLGQMMQGIARLPDTDGPRQQG